MYQQENGRQIMELEENLPTPYLDQVLASQDRSLLDQAVAATEQPGSPEYVEAAMQRFDTWQKASIEDTRTGAHGAVARMFLRWNLEDSRANRAAFRKRVLRRLKNGKTLLVAVETSYQGDPESYNGQRCACGKYGVCMLVQPLPR